MRIVWELARLQLLESVRRQVHLVTVFLAFGMLVLPAYVNAFSMGLGAFERVAKDFGLTLISYYGVGLAILTASSVVPRDLERRTLYPILSRPVSRLAYLAGQVGGLALLLAGSLLLLGLCLTLSVGSLAQHFDTGILVVVSGYILECWVLATACLCFSTFCSPPLAGVLGTFVWVLGGLSDSFIRFFIREDRGSHATAAFAQFAKGLLPNFEVFRLKQPVVHNLPIPEGYLPAAAAYGLGWMLLFLLLAHQIFRRRDL